MPELYIAIYAPTTGNYEHWALALSPAAVASTSKHSSEDESLDDVQTEDLGSKDFSSAQQTCTIYEVSGAHPSFIPQQTTGSAIDTRREGGRHLRSIQVGSIASSELAELQRCVASVAVDNDTVDWCCQDYVVEILDKLVEECVLDEDDEVYVQGREEAMGQYFGAL